MVPCSQPTRNIPPSTRYACRPTSQEGGIASSTAPIRFEGSKTISPRMIGRKMAGGNGGEARPPPQPPPRGGPTTRAPPPREKNARAHPTPAYWLSAEHQHSTHR